MCLGPPHLPLAYLINDALQTDVSDEAKVQALVAGAVKWGGSVDLYVNNAWKFAFGNVNSVSNSGMPTMVTSHPAPEALCTPALCKHHVHLHRTGVLYSISSFW